MLPTNASDEDIKNYIASLKKTKPSTTSNNFHLDPVTFKEVRDLDFSIFDKVQSNIIKEDVSFNTTDSSTNEKVQFTDIKVKEEEKKHIETNCTFDIDLFKNGKSPYVKSIIKIDTIFEYIKTGNGNLSFIELARNAGKGSTQYDIIKMEILPSVRFNFNFNVSAKDKNIKSPTGLIFIDIDNINELDTTNKYIYSAWKSLSNTGYGILVKIDGLTLKNFSTNYLHLSTLLGITSDIGAKKATQQTILSYDKDIFINNNSIVFKAINEKVQFNHIKKGREEKKHIETNCTLQEYKGETRFNNITDYFKDESPYIVFEEKENLMIPFIPKSIIGNRSSNMFSYLSQIALLNTQSNFNLLLSIANSFNKHCQPPLNIDKVIAIVNDVIMKKNKNELIENRNKERRIIFNPLNKMDKNEKQKIVNQEVGKIRTEKSKQEIHTIIENWDFLNSGKITQKKVSDLTGKSIRTIKTYWDELKDNVNEMNKGFKISPKVIEIKNAEKEVQDLLIVESEITAKITFEDFYFTPKNIKYSNIEFRLGNGVVVLIPNAFLEKWNASLDKKGLMNRFKYKNWAQATFDYDLWNQFMYFGL